MRHFADEEALLEQRHTVDLAAHKRAHAGLLARAEKLRADAAAGTATTGGLIEFLANDIVARHLFTADRDFFRLFEGCRQERASDASAGATGATL